MTWAGVQGYCETEGQLAAQDRMQRDTNDKKNDLESYIYSLRGKLADVLAAYAPDSVKEALSSRLTEMEVRAEQSQIRRFLFPLLLHHSLHCLCGFTHTVFGSLHFPSEVSFIKQSSRMTV